MKAPAALPRNVRRESIPLLFRHPMRPRGLSLLSRLVQDFDSVDAGVIAQRRQGDVQFPLSVGLEPVRAPGHRAPAAVSLFVDIEGAVQQNSVAENIEHAAAGSAA